MPLARGAGVITTMVRADGLLRIPSFIEGLNAGEEIPVELLRPEEEIENTILCTGSHDLAIGVLEDQLKLRHPTEDRGNECRQLRRFAGFAAR